MLKDQKSTRKVQKPVALKSSKRLAGKLVAIIFALFVTQSYATECFTGHGLRRNVHHSRIVHHSGIGYGHGLYSRDLAQRLLLKLTEPDHYGYSSYAPSDASQIKSAIKQQIRSDALYDEFQEFQQYKAYKQGLRDGQTQSLNDVGEPHVEPVATSIITQKCGKCHSASTPGGPKSGILLDITNGISCETLLDAFDAIENNRMPVNAEHKPIPMTEAEKQEFRKEGLKYRLD